MITRLGFAVDMTGVRQYDAALQNIRRSVTGLSQSLRDLPRNVSIRASRDLEQVGGAGHRAAGGIERVHSAGSAFNRGSAGFLNRLGEFAENMEELGEAAYMAGMAILAIPLAGDRMQTNLGRINAELQDTEQSAEVYERLYQMVRATGAGISETVQAFGSYNSVMEDSGKTTEDAIRLMAGLQTAMAKFNIPADEINKTMDKVGKALEEGKFGKADFFALTDIPQLQEYLQKAFKVDRAGLRKLLGGKLSTKDLLDTILGFARGQDPLEIPLKFSREWQSFVTTIDRFAAEIDNAFKFSERLARALRGISDTLERWRPGIKALADNLGDLRSHVAALVVLAYALGGPLIGMFTLLAAKAALVVIAFLAIEDFFSWLMGKDTLIGRALGPFEDVKANLLSQIEELKKSFLGLFGVGEGASPEWTQGWAAWFGQKLDEIESKLRNLMGLQEQEPNKGWLKWLFEWGNAADAVFIKLAQTIGSVLVTAFNSAASAINGVADAWQRLVTNMGGQSPVLGPSGNFWLENFFRRLGRSGPGGANGPGVQLLPEVPPGTAIGPSSFNAPTSQNNDMRIDVTVNAAGTSGAEIAAGARNGLAAAGRDLMADLGGVARGLAMSMPRSELAAG